MKPGKWAWPLPAAVFLLSGCAGFWVSPTSSGSSGCTTNCTTETSGNFYILNGGSTPQIVGESIQSGKLTAVGSATTMPAAPYSMTMPTSSLLYVSTAAGVYLYPVSGGSLGTAVQISQDVAALAIVVDTSGRWLIEAQQGSGGITMGAVPLNSSGEDAGTEITTSYPVANAAIPDGAIALSSDDSNIFVALGSGGTIVVPFNAGAGGATSPFGAKAPVIPVVNSSAGAALSVAVDPSARLFYVGETNANSTKSGGALRAFLYSSLGSASVTEISGSPISTSGGSPSGILPLSSYVYVASGNGMSTGSIVSFAITSTTISSGIAYSIASGSSVSAGTGPLSLAEDASGQFVLAVNSSGNPYFDSYTFDSTTAGKLDVQITANTGASPMAVVAVP